MRVYYYYSVYASEVAAPQPLMCPCTTCMLGPGKTGNN